MNQQNHAGFSFISEQEVKNEDQQENPGKSFGGHVVRRPTDFFLVIDDDEKKEDVVS